MYSLRRVPRYDLERYFMIANDARAMVYDTLYKYEYDIPQELEDKINEEIISAAERMKFRCKAELFPCDDKRAQDVEFRRNIVVYYHSLGYNCYVTPCDGNFVLVVEW